MSKKYDNLFNTDFFPTPTHVLDLMELDVQNKKILEPQAGKGNIIDYCTERGAKVYWCEINKDLAKICKNKGEQIGTDFLELKAEDIPFIDSIIMNPPFSEFKKHFLHAWEIASDGCEIVSLCNNDALKNLYYDSEIKKIIENFGYSNNLGNVFKNAERMTEVEIGLIKVYKPINADSIDFDDYFDNVIDDDFITQSSGVVKFTEIDALISKYKAILKNIDSVFNVIKEFKNLNSLLNLDVSFGFEISYNKKISTPHEYIKQLQKIVWHKVFDMFEMNKYLTSGVVRDINSWLENKSHTPFTKRNIYKMVEVIVGTREQSFNRAVVEAIDEFTKHTHENRYGVEGWKTNSGYLLNKKFIIDYVFETSWGGGSIQQKYSSNTRHLDDLIKVLCNLTGKNYDSITPIFKSSREYITPNYWHESEFFEWKGFKKGTMHLKFKDVKVWEILNRKYAEIKGNVLPEKI